MLTKKIFRIKNSIIVVAIIIVLLFVLLTYFDRAIWGQNSMVVIPIIITITSLICLFNIIFTRYIIDDTGISIKSLIMKINIHWNEVEYIALQTDAKFVKVCVCVLGNSKVIGLSNWIKGYKKLIEITLEKTKENDKTKIGEGVYEILQ